MIHSVSTVQFKEDGYLKYSPPNSYGFRMSRLMPRLPLCSGYTIQPHISVFSGDHNRGINKTVKMHPYSSKTGKGRASAPVKPVMKMGHGRTPSK